MLPRPCREPRRSDWCKNWCKAHMTPTLRRHILLYPNCYSNTWMSFKSSSFQFWATFIIFCRNHASGFFYFLFLVALQKSSYPANCQTHLPKNRCQLKCTCSWGQIDVNSDSIQFCHSKDRCLTQKLIWSWNFHISLIILWKLLIENWILKV